MIASGAVAFRCGREEAPVAFDLVARWTQAAARADTALVDFGSRAARRSLLAGWAPRRAAAAGLLRGQGEASGVRFFLAAPRPLRLEVRAGAPGAPGGIAAEVPVGVEINGRTAGALRLAPELGEHELELPQDLLRSGENELLFRYPGGDGGPAVFDWLRLRPAVDGLPEADAAGGFLRLPLGSEVAYFLELETASLLRLDGIDVIGAAGELDPQARLLVFLQEEGGAEHEVRGFEPGQRPVRLELAGGGSRLVKLSLRAAGEPGPGRALLLRRPRVHAPAAPSAVAAERPASSRPAPATRPNLLVYLVDTLRADRLGCYGATAGLTPAIDAFARQAVLFERASTSAPWTRPAVATLLTGLDPLEHGVLGLDDRLPEAASTLPERLRAAGYRTAALSTNWHVTRRTGMDQGFDDFLLFPEDPHPEAVVRRALAWLDRRAEREAGAPFFLYVHALDPHAPYEPPEELRRRFAPGSPAGGGTTAALKGAYAARGEERRRRVAQLAGLYDAEVAWADRGFGDLLAGLRQRGLDRDTLIVLLADHGEELDEHGELGHARDLYGETLVVPLLIKPVTPPGTVSGRREAAAVGLLDVAPTLLAAAGLDARDLPGRDLLSAQALAGAAARPLFAHLSYERRRGLAVLLGDWKLVLPASALVGGAAELYDRRAAPAGHCADLEDQAARNPVRAGFLEAALRAELARARPRWGRETTSADEEERRALRALGYQ